MVGNKKGWVFTHGSGPGSSAVLGSGVHPMAWSISGILSISRIKLRFHFVHNVGPDPGEIGCAPDEDCYNHFFFLKNIP